MKTQTQSAGYFGRSEFDRVSIIDVKDIKRIKIGNKKVYSGIELDKIQNQIISNINNNSKEI